jgi:type IV secretory pathway TrbD component
VAGMTRTIVSLTLVALATAGGYLAIEAWRDAIAGAGIALSLWIVASKVFQRIARFRPPRTSLFDSAMRSVEPRPDRPADLQAIERLFGWRTYAPDEFDGRIRPFIRRLVDSRLQDRAGVDLSSDFDRAVTLLGPNLRQLLVERREVHADTAQIASLIDEVEAL